MMRYWMMMIAGALVTAACWSEGDTMRGPLPAEQREAIHKMATSHNDIQREVKLTESGYTATTTSENKDVVAKLKAHIAYMSKRLGSGAMVRRWDPAFVEIVQHHDDMDVEVEALDNGIRVVVTGKTPEAVKVAQNHARIVSGFVKDGRPAVRQKHAPVLEAEQADKKD